MERCGFMISSYGANEMHQAWDKQLLWGTLMSKEIAIKQDSKCIANQPWCAIAYEDASAKNVLLKIKRKNAKIVKDQSSFFDP